MKASEPRRLVLILILGSLTALGPLSIDMYLPAFPTIADGFAVPASHVQFSLTFFLLGLAFGQLLAGPLSDIYGRRIPLLVGLGIFACASLLCALSPSIWTLILLRLVQGLAGAAGIVISRAMVRDLYSGTEMTKFFTLLMMIHGAGPVLAPIAGAQLLRVTSWHGVFVTLGLIGLLLFFAVMLKIPESLRAENRSTGGLKETLTACSKLLQDRSFMGLALTQGFVSAAILTYISGSSFVLQNIFGVSPQGYSFIFALNGVGFIIASQITGRLVGRISEMKLLLSGLIVVNAGGVSLLILSLAGAGLIAILPSFFLIVSSVGIVGPTTTSLALQSYGKSAGSAAALLGVLSLVIGGMVSPLVGIVGIQSAIPMGVVIAVVSVSSLLCYLFMIRGSALKAKNRMIEER